MLAFVAANALEANSKANPITTLFDTVVNFIAAPFFVSRSYVEKRLGRPGSRSARKNTCVSARIAYNAAAGVVQTSHKLALPRWGFSHLGRQTECERIPRPRKILESIRPASPLRRPYPLRVTTRWPPLKFLFVAMPSYFLGRGAYLSGSKKSR